MWLQHATESLTLTGPTGLTIGAFDGVHLGHQALIRRMVSEAHQAGMQAVVLTFDPLPSRVLGHNRHGILSPLEDKLEFLETLGPDGVVVQPFNRRVARISATDFVAWLVERLALRALWVGPDFALGHNHEGNVPFLKTLGAQYGFAVHVLAETIHLDGAPVRSSRIRRALLDGDLAQANTCLGRPYRLTGVVEHGDQRGRRLGFPTANVRVHAEQLLPAHGVYICQAHLHTTHHVALVNIGTRPTFDQDKLTVEAHLLDFAQDIYGTVLKLDFLQRLRPELRFASVEALVAQMQADLENARRWGE